MQYYMGSAFFTQSYPPSEALNFVYVHQGWGTVWLIQKLCFVGFVCPSLFDLPYVINERE